MLMPLAYRWEGEGRLTFRRDPKSLHPPFTNRNRSRGSSRFETKNLSHLVLSCLVVSRLVLSCLVLSCLVFSRLVLSCLVLSCRVLSCLVLSCLVLSCLVLLSSSLPRRTNRAVACGQLVFSPRRRPELHWSSRSDILSFTRGRSPWPR